MCLDNGELSTEKCKKFTTGELIIYLANDNHGTGNESELEEQQIWLHFSQKGFAVYEIKDGRTKMRSKLLLTSVIENND